MKSLFRMRVHAGAIGIAGTAVAAIVLVVGGVFLAMTKEPITIGAIIPLSGSASYHVDVADAMLLAADEVNARGGINGRELRIVLEDSKTDPQEGVRAFHRIETEHPPLAYVVTTSAVTTAVAPVAEQRQAVMIGLITVASALTRERKWVFRYSASAESEIRPILYHLKALNIKTLGVLYQRDEFGVPMFERIAEEFADAGGAVEGEAFEVGARDYRVQIEKLFGMEAIFAVGFGRHMERVLKELHRLHYNGIILGNPIVCDPGFRQMPEADGVYVAAPFAYNPNYPFAQEAKKHFEQRYKKPFNQRAANGYDVIRLLALLLEDRDISRKSLRDLLERGFLYSGVFGDIELERGGHEIVIPFYPARIAGRTVQFLQ